MEIISFSSAWWYALGTIVLLDLVLASDNALLIGITASKVANPSLRKKVIFWGGMGAIAIRFLTAGVAVLLLGVPGAMLVAGGVLCYLAYGLWKDTPEVHSLEASAVAGGLAVGAAIRTIIIGDASMGIENSIAIAGVSAGSWDLIVIGLLLTVPVIFMGANLVIKLVERFPVVTKVGAVLLLAIGLKMMTHDKLLASFFSV